MIVTREVGRTRLAVREDAIGVAEAEVAEVGARRSGGQKLDAKRPDVWRDMHARFGQTRGSTLFSRALGA